MPLTTTATARTSAAPRAFVALASGVVLLGVADSMVGAYLVLFASDSVHLTPVQVGLFVSAPAAGGLVISTLAGRLFDRRPTRLFAILGAGSSAVGFALLTATTSFVALLLVALTLLAALQTVFPQLFALARVVLDDGGAGRRAVPLLRSGWSLAWAVGPLAGAALLARAGFDGVLWAAAAVLVAVVVTTALTPAPGRRRQVDAGPARASPVPARDREVAPAVGPRRVVALVAAVGLFFLALYIGSVALPLYVTQDLHRPGSTVGVLYSVCAAVEVLAALALAALPERVGQRALILGGMLALAVFFALAVLARGTPVLLVAQVPRGIAIAVVGAAGIRLFQDLMGPATGRATTLFANATTAGSMLAGVLAGASVQLWGVVTTLVLSGALAVAATAGFAVATAGLRPLRSSSAA